MERRSGQRGAVMDKQQLQQRLLELEREKQMCKREGYFDLLMSTYKQIVQVKNQLAVAR